jgi:hypothetical protein
MCDVLFKMLCYNNTIIRWFYMRRRQSITCYSRLKAMFMAVAESALYQRYCEAMFVQIYGPKEGKEALQTTWPLPNRSQVPQP